MPPFIEQRKSLILGPGNDMFFTRQRDPAWILDCIQIAADGLSQAVMPFAFAKATPAWPLPLSLVLYVHFGGRSAFSDLRGACIGVIIDAMSTRAVDIEKLDVEERLRLIEELWESLSGDPSRIPLTQAQKEELDRRLDEIEGGDDAGIPWNDVLDRIRNRLV